MEDLGTTVGFDINEALESVLHGKESPEEREEALIDFIKKYEASANECIEDWRTRALAKNATMVLVSILSALAGAGITALFFVL